MQLTHSLALPRHYRTEDLLSFYQRDPHSPTETVSAQQISKALFYDHHRALLTLNFTEQQLDACLQLDSNSEPAPTQNAFNAWIEHLAGVTQDVAGFESTFSEHPELGPIIEQQRGLRFAQTSTAFEAISWAIMGQQVSVAAAVSLRRKLIQLVNQPHSSGLLCYPSAQQVSSFSVEELRGIGLSTNKAHALHNVSHKIADGIIHFDYQMTTQQAEQLQEQLLSIRGIGPWTVNYTLMRGCAWLDGSVHGDAAVQRYLKQLLGQEQITAKQTQTWLAQFSPWRALAAAHLWQSAGLAA